MNKKFYLAAFALFLLFASNTDLKAQPGFDDDVQDTPIDGGVSLLVGAGVAYGVSRLRKQKSDTPAE